MATVLTPERTKELIQEWIVPNGKEEIRADMFNTILSAIMSYVGVGYACKGVAPQYAPSSEVPVLYIGGPGTYKAYYNEDVVVPQGSIIIWTNNLEGAWSHTILDVATSIVAAEVQRATEKEGQLQQQITSNAEGLAAEVQRATGKEGQMQEQINANAEGLAAEVQRATGKEGQMQEQIDTNTEGLAAEILRAQAAESRLQDIYEGLTQNSVVVGPLPSSGQADTIYRVPGTSSYADYMWDGMQFVLMATYTAGHVALINVNVLNHDQGTPHAAYASAAAARADITAASGLRALGLQITYLLTNGIWYTDQYIGTDISGWSNASNWKTLGPVTVTQNTETGKTELKIGDNVALTVDKEPESNSHNLVESGGVKGKENEIRLAIGETIQFNREESGLTTFFETNIILKAGKVYAATNNAESGNMAFNAFNPSTGAYISDVLALNAGASGTFIPSSDILLKLYSTVPIDCSLKLINPKSYINVNKLNSVNGVIASGYADSSAARAAVLPTDLRVRGQIITYLLTDGKWYIEQFIGTDVANWVIDSNWSNPHSELQKQISENKKQIVINDIAPLLLGDKFLKWGSTAWADGESYFIRLNGRELITIKSPQTVTVAYAFLTSIDTTVAPSFVTGTSAQYVVNNTESVIQAPENECYLCVSRYEASNNTDRTPVKLLINDISVLDSVGDRLYEFEKKTSKDIESINLSPLILGDKLIKWTSDNWLDGSCYFIELKGGEVIRINPKPSITTAYAFLTSIDTSNAMSLVSGTQVAYAAYGETPEKIIVAPNQECYLGISRYDKQANTDRTPDGLFINGVSVLGRIGERLFDFEKSSREKIEIFTTDTQNQIADKLIYVFTRKNCDVFFKTGEYTFDTVFAYLVGKGYEPELPIGGNCRYYLNNSTITAVALSSELQNVKPFGTQRSRQDLEMYDGVLICEGGSYCIHDEANQEFGYSRHVYKNLDMIYKTTSLTQSHNKCFGCGLGEAGTIIVQDCTFNTDNDNQYAQDFAIHSANNWQTLGLVHNFKAVISNCWFSRGLRVDNSKPTGHRLEIQCSNNSYKEIVKGDWTWIDFNNTVRS